MDALATLFTSIANVIREKTGETATIKPTDFADKIATLSAVQQGGMGGGGTSGGDDLYDYDMTVGQYFHLEYSGSSPSVQCPSCMSYVDDGGVLIFTAESEGTGTVVLSRSDTIIGEYTVRVSAASSGGGGGGTPTILTGTFKASTGSPYVATHNAGVVPDFILVYARATPDADIIDMAYGFSAKMKTALGSNAKGLVRGTVSVGSSLGASTSSIEEDMEQTTTSMDAKGPIRAVTTTTFTIGGTDLGLFTSKTYAWVALCGLV